KPAEGVLLRGARHPLRQPLRTLGTQPRELLALCQMRGALTCQPVGRDPLLQCRVVEIAREAELLSEQQLLPAGWVEAILERAPKHLLRLGGAPDATFRCLRAAAGVNP